MNFMNAKEVLIYLTQTLLFYLEELSEVEIDLFTHGEITAFVECLEIVQHWEEAKMHGLDFEIEEIY